MKTHLEYSDEKSNKFWKIEVSGKSHTVTYGKIGSKGTSKTKEFETAEKALKDAEKLVKAKTKKGYKEVASSPLLVADQQETDQQEASNLKPQNSNSSFKAIFTEDEQGNQGIETVDRYWGTLALYDIKSEEKCSAMLQQLFDYYKDQIESASNYWDYDQEVTFGMINKDGKFEATETPYTQILEKYPSLTNHFKDYVSFHISLGKTIAFDEDVYGIKETVTLALFDPKYIDLFIQLLRNDDLGHETIQGEYIEQVISHYGLENDEAMALLAARAALPSQHGEEDLHQYNDEYDIQGNPELFNRFLNAFFYELQFCHSFKKTRHHLIPDSFMKYTFRVFDINVKQTHYWNVSLMNLVENAQKGKLFDFSGFLYAMDLENGIQSEPPKAIPNEMVEAYLNLAEYYTTENQIEQSQIMLDLISSENAQPHQLTIKYYNELLNLSATNKDTKVIQKKFDKAYKEQSEFGNWVFDALYTWIKDAELTEDQKEFCTELTNRMEHGMEIQYHLIKRKKMRNAFDTFSYTLKGNSLSYYKNDEKEPTTFKYKSKEKLDAEIIELIKQKRAEGYIKASTPEENRAFLKACKNNDLEKIKSYFNSDFQLDFWFRLDNKSFVPAHYAMHQGNIAVNELIIHHLLDNYENTGEHWKLLKYANDAMHQTNELYQLILNTDYQITEKEYPDIYRRSGSFSLETIKLLFEKTDWKKHDDGKFILSACTQNNPEQLDFLIEQGALPQYNGHGFPNCPIYSALSNEMGLVVIKKLWENGAEFPKDYENDHRQFKLKEGNKDSVAYLNNIQEELKSKVSAENILKSEESLNNYLKNGGDPDLKDEHGIALLHYAMITGKLTKQLILNGANVHIRDNDGRTALHYIDFKPSKHNDSILKLLIEKGAELNEIDEFGYTPAFFHAQFRPKKPNGIEFNKWDDYKIVKIIMNFVDLGLNLKQKDLQGKTVLNYLVNIRGHKVDLFKKILTGNVDLSIRDKAGRTFIHDFVLSKKYSSFESQVMAMMANHPTFNANIQDKEGNTALHLAILTNNTWATRQLLEMGANPILKNKAKLTAEDLLTQKGRNEGNIAYTLQKVKEEILNPKEIKWEAIKISETETQDVKAMEVMGNFPSFIDEWETYFDFIKLFPTCVVIWRNSVRCLSLETGNTIWQNRPYYNFHSYRKNMLCTIDGQLDGKKYKGAALIDPATDIILWKKRINALRFLTTNKRILCHSKSKLFELEPSSGKTIWETKINVSYFFFHLDSVVVVGSYENKFGIYTLDYDGQVEHSVLLNDSISNIKECSFIDRKIWFTTEVNEKTYQIITVDIQLGIQKILFDEQHKMNVQNAHAPFCLNGNIYAFLKKKNSDEQVGIYKIDEQGNYELVTETGHTWRDQIIIGTDCVYIINKIGAPPYYVTEYNLKNPDIRETLVDEMPGGADLNNGTLALVHHGRKDKEFRIQFIQ